ncbi:hypothetical protein PHMEG_00026410, partial [Phytophthora megakarya]
FFQRLSSDALNCGYPGCASVEPERHLFFDCPHVTPLWQFVTNDWSALIYTISWDHVWLLTAPTWPARAHLHSHDLSILWMIPKSITIHVIWTARNKHQFEGHPPLQAFTAIYHVYAIFSAQFRSLLRSSEAATCNRLQESIHGFPASSSLHRFGTAHPRLFARRRRAFFTNDEGALQAPPGASESLSLEVTHILCLF